MNLVFGHDQMVAEWVAQQLGITIAPPYSAIGGTIDGQTLCAGAVFNNWNGSNMDITLYGKGGMAREAFAGVAHYVFVQAGANRLTAITRRSNVMMKKHLPKLGFKFEGVSERHFGPTRDDDGLRFGLLKENASKWLSHEQLTAAAAA